MKFTTKPIQRYWLHLIHVATLPGKFEIQISADIQQILKDNANKLHFKWTHYNSSMRITGQPCCKSLCLDIIIIIIIDTVTSCAVFSG